MDNKMVYDTANEVLHYQTSSLSCNGSVMPPGAPEGTSEPRTPTLHQLPLGGSDLSAILVHVVRKLSVARNRNPLIQVHMVRPHLRPVTLFCLRHPLHQRPTFAFKLYWSR
jgi:hypothetical protein